MNIKKCIIEQCDNKAHKADKYCCKHRSAQEAHGHPLASAIKRTAYRTYLRPVKALITNSIDTHAGVRSAINDFDAWLQSSTNEEARIVERYHMHRLQKARVKAIDILVEIAALHVYAKLNPEVLPLDNRFVTACGRSILRLAPSEKVYRLNINTLRDEWQYIQYNGANCRRVGNVILPKYLPLLEIITDACIEMFKESQQEITARQEPIQAVNS